MESSPTNQPVQEVDSLLKSLISFGINEELAKEALFATDNQSLDAALNYIYSQDSESSDDENHEQYKMTFVVNHSLKMGVGKIAAQVAHACLGLYQTIQSESKDTILQNLSSWNDAGSKKIVLKGLNAEHLEEIRGLANASGIPSFLVHDAGHTQIPAGSTTVLALFGKDSDIDPITGTLQLL